MSIDFRALPPLRDAAGRGTWTVRDAKGGEHGPLNLDGLTPEVLKLLQSHGARVTITTAKGARLVYEPFGLGIDTDTYLWYHG